MAIQCCKFFARRILKSCLICMVVVSLVSIPLPVVAAELAGVTLPDTASVGTTKLVLNGIGLRTYSALGVHIYIAGLYLQQPSHDADAILFSPSVKLLRLHFVHDVSVDSIRGAWRTELASSCITPCKLSQSILSQFLAALQPVHAGEDIMLVFKRDGLDAYCNKVYLGHIADAQFTQLMLAVFIGKNASQPRLKQQLLGN